jgi:hypothetical protein
MSENGVTCGETSFSKFSVLAMTITPPGISTYADSQGNCTEQTVKTSQQQAVTKDRNSDGQTTNTVALSFQFYGCKLLKTLYLFIPFDPVILNAIVSVTEKTRHSSALASQDRNHVAGTNPLTAVGGWFRWLLLKSRDRTWIGSVQGAVATWSMISM